jgi:hypothetical protein
VRTEAQEVWDAVALILLFDEVNKKSSVDGRLKIQNLTFLLELTGQERGLRMAHYRFLRYTHGAFSPTLAADVKKLHGLAFFSGAGNVLTKRGRFIVDYVSDWVSSSATGTKIHDLVAEIARKYGKLSGTALRDLVLSMTIPVAEHSERLEKLADVPILVDLLDPERKSGLSEVDLPANLAAELAEEFALDPNALNPSNASYIQSVRKALKAADELIPIESYARSSQTRLA